MRAVTGIVLTVVATILTSSSPSAWGEEGHKIVCAIAYQILDQADKAEIDRLSRTYRLPDGSHFRYFTVSCNFADTARTNARKKLKDWVRFSPFENWHFLNVPRDTRTIPATACSGDCVSEGIRFHHQKLASASLGDQERAEALLFMSHWVGDIHQPLHVSFADDRGGNSIQPIQGGLYSAGDLHAVWDTGVIAITKNPNDWWSYATTLRGDITATEQQQWNSVPIAEWAQESYDTTAAASTQYCKWAGSTCDSIPGGRMLKTPYQKAAAAIVRKRLQQAGSRLAALIRSALHP